MQNYKDLEFYQLAPKAQSAKRRAQSAKRRAQDAKGITLMEMVAVIVVLGLAIPPLLTMWADVALKSGRSEVIADATFYAQELMEEIKLGNHRFDENTSSPWSSSLGPDTSTKGLDETNNEATSPPTTNKNNWDDVDDFDDYSDNPATGYTRSCDVDYVELSGSTWQAATSPPTDFKRITVAVSRTDNLISDVSLVTIVAAY